jgi:sterol desaturase/sphingolipid hydroxylase (fatty acid hydroxylase superfamily)
MRHASCDARSMHAADLLARWIFVLAIDAARYAIPTSIAFGVFWVLGRERFRHRRIREGHSPIAHDIARSIATVLVFSLVGVAVWVGGNVGVFRRYEAIADRGWPWFVASIAICIVLQDTYFYWTHRAMHHPRLYRLFHRAHHEAKTASPFTSYAFALPEALVHALFVPLVWLVVPMHELAVFAFLVFMILRNVLGHLSIELCPSGFTRHPLWGWHTTTTHHALHHAHAGFDFGLYFTVWDRLMGTTHPRYHETFERITTRDPRAACVPTTRDRPA